MSVIAWDGKFLAVDRMAVSSGLKIEQVKSKKINHEKLVLAWTGDIGSGLAMAKWYQDSLQSPITPFPPCQNDRDRWCRLVVADKTGVFYYEQEPLKIEVREKFMAWGAGRDFALGVLAMGGSAPRAVEIASQFSDCCGLGIDVYDLSEL